MANNLSNYDANSLSKTPIYFLYSFYIFLIRSQQDYSIFTMKRVYLSRTNYNIDASVFRKIAMRSNNFARKPFTNESEDKIYDDNSRSRDAQNSREH